MGGGRWVGGGQLDGRGGKERWEREEDNVSDLPDLGDVEVLLTTVGHFRPLGLVVVLGRLASTRELVPHRRRHISQVTHVRPVLSFELGSLGGKLVSGGARVVPEPTGQRSNSKVLQVSHAVERCGVAPGGGQVLGLGGVEVSQKSGQAGVGSLELASVTGAQGVDGVAELVDLGAPRKLSPRRCEPRPVLAGEGRLAQRAGP